MAPRQGLKELYSMDIFNDDAQEDLLGLGEDKWC
jgi:hypothetical protein